MTVKEHQTSAAETLAQVEQLGALPDAPLAMPKQRVEPVPSGIASLLFRRPALPRLSANDRGR